MVHAVIPRQCVADSSALDLLARHTDPLLRVRVEYLDYEQRSAVCLDLVARLAPCAHCRTLDELGHAAHLTLYAEPNLAQSGHLLRVHASPVNDKPTRLDLGSRLAAGTPVGGTGRRRRLREFEARVA